MYIRKAVSSLFFTAGPNAGRKYELGRGEYLVGRRSDCEIFVPDMRVSRRHARIAKIDGHWTIKDLGSNNGTYVNSERIKTKVLVHGDEIRIAHNTMTVEIPVTTRSSQIANVTIVDLANPEIIHSRDEATSTSVLSEILRQSGPNREQLLERKLIALSSILDISSKSNDPKEMLDSLCSQLLEVFPQADSVGVLVEDEKTKQLKVQTQRMRDRSIPPEEEVRVPGTIVSHVISDQRGILLQSAGEMSPVSDVADLEGSRMGAPIRVQSHNYGVIYVQATLKEFSQEDVDLLTSIAAQAGLTIHNARMQQDLQLQQRIERDLRVARQIQRSLLPPKPPSVDGMRFAVHYEPAYQIGGDFYDFIWHDKDNLALVVGDVSGKAISAALYMARLTSELRTRASTSKNPAQLLAQVNHEMMRLGDDGMFATLIYAVYNLQKRSLLFTNAGHMVPLLKRKGRVFPLEAETAHVAPMGVLPDLEIAEARVQMQADDLLVLTTDGVHEAKDAEGNEYGADRLKDCIEKAEGGPEGIVQAILADIDSHVSEDVQMDDLTILAVSSTAQKAKRL